MLRYTNHLSLPLVLTLLGSHAAVGQDIRTVALSDMPPTGLPQGLQFGALDGATIDANGRVAFRAGPNPRSESLWVEENGVPRLIAYTGGQVPGESEEVRWSQFDFELTFNSAGNLLFEGSVIGTDPPSPSFHRGLWVDQAGSLWEAMQSGDVAPGAQAGEFFVGSSLNRILTKENEVFFQDYITSEGVFPPTGLGVWQGDGQTLSPVAISGQPTPVPELGADATRDFRGIGDFDASGNVLLPSKLEGTGISDTNDDSVWWGRPDDLAMVAREGDQATGLPDGVQYASFKAFSSPYRDTGVHFSATLSGNGVDESNDEAVWSVDDSGLTLIMRKGDQAPMMPAGVRFASLGAYRLSEGSDQVVFLISLSGPGIDDTNRLAVFAGLPESLRLVGQQGQQAPGTSDGAAFGSAAFGFLQQNQSGQVAFTSQLVGGGIHDGVWAEDGSGVLRLIARAGDQLEVMPGDFRTIRDVLTSPGNNAFNNRGELLLAMRFVDGTSGLFVANVGVVPEPATLWLLSMIGIFHLWRIRGKHDEQ